MDIVKVLRSEESKLVQQLEAIRTAIRSLTGNPGRAKRKVSAAARAKMAKAQRARWAKVKK